MADASYIYNLPLAFSDVAAAHPTKTALLFEDGSSLTFEQLHHYSNQLAQHLLEKNIGAGDVVCIAGDKNQTTYATILACLKIGAPYAVLDYESPIARLEKIIERCKPKALLAKAELIEWLSHLPALTDIVFIENEQALDSEVKQYDPTATPESGSVTGDSPAYIMFTSGSTGFPKGAVMTHANVLNFIAWGKRDFDVRLEDVFTNVNPLYFDNSVYDFYVSIFNGATLAPFSKELVSQPAKLVEKIDEAGCTAWFSVPSLLIYLMSSRVLTTETFRSMRRIVFGGEGYPKGRLKQLFELYGDRVTLYNVYGPTECTCMCSSYIISDVDFEDVHGFPPLGSIISNFGHQIVDEDLNPVSPGEAGELTLLGPNVGRGYYNDPERTAAHFVQNKQNPMYAEIMYKTGDLVRYNEQDDKIYILGRVDNQIKHMGYRIELEEIENGLCCLEYVAQAAVVHGERRGLSQLLAVLQVKENAVDIAASTIRDDLKKVLPLYMIPTDFKISTAELMKNQNGKIDRKAMAREFFGEGVRNG